jgi:hypothetical protein
VLVSDNCYFLAFSKKICGFFFDCLAARFSFGDNNGCFLVSFLAFCPLLMFDSNLLD